MGTFGAVEVGLAVTAGVPFSIGRRETTRAGMTTESLLPPHNAAQTLNVAMQLRGGNLLELARPVEGFPTTIYIAGKSTNTGCLPSVRCPP